MHARSQLGTHGEALVAHHLQAQGFTVLAMNYTKRYGEIDIIAECDELLVFVEVKVRRSHYFDLSQVITPSKQRKIIITAKAYLAENNCFDKACRFDVALIEYENDQPKLTYIPHAFVE